MTKNVKQNVLTTHCSALEMQIYCGRGEGGGVQVLRSATGNLYLPVLLWGGGCGIKYGIRSSGLFWLCVGIPCPLPPPLPHHQIFPLALKRRGSETCFFFLSDVPPAACQGPGNSSNIYAWWCVFCVLTILQNVLYQLRMCTGYLVWLRMWLKTLIRKRLSVRTNQMKILRTAGRSFAIFVNCTVQTCISTKSITVM